MTLREMKAELKVGRSTYSK